VVFPCLYVFVLGVESLFLGRINGEETVDDFFDAWTSAEAVFYSCGVNIALL